MAKIIWSEIDEAPALATYSLLPIVQAFCKGTGVDVETRIFPCLAVSLQTSLRI